MLATLRRQTRGWVWLESLAWLVLAAVGFFWVSLALDWCVAFTCKDAKRLGFDTYLVLSFVGETRILAINADDELDEAEIEGFLGDTEVRH